MRLVYVTHPQVCIDPAVPVPDWGLSEVGRGRAEAACRQRWLTDVTRIVASTERKAMETADILARSRGIAVEVREDLQENDRSSTGFLPPAEFERVADSFFACPTESIRGWERAVDAQARIARRVDGILAEPRAPGALCLVGHGGVGTLLFCHLSGLSIERKYDQPAGGGCYFTFDIAARRVLHGWRSIDQPNDNLP
jgi:broad specificity phosphatase PhoE